MYIIKRQFKHYSDYLSGFDNRWMTIWRNKEHAHPFVDKQSAEKAIADIIEGHRILMPDFLPDTVNYEIADVVVNPGIQSRIEPVPTDPTAIDGAILEESVMPAGDMENDDKYMDSLNT